MLHFKILTNIEETDENIEQSKFFGSPIFPEKFLEENGVENDFFFLQINLKDLNYFNGLLPSEGMLYFFLDIKDNPLKPKVFYKKDELVEIYEDINEDFNMANYKAMFLIKSDESSNVILEDKDDNIITLLKINLEEVPQDFPKFNQTKGNVKFLIEKEKLEKLDFSQVTIKFE